MPDSTSDAYVRFLEATSTQVGQRHPASELLELRPEQRCLDVGCGIGEDARATAKAFNAQLVGIDNNPRMVEVAQSRSAAFPSVTFQTAEATKLPFPNATFEAAWVKRTLMHIANPAPVLSEIVRVVKPGGRIVAVEPDLELVVIDSGMAEVTRKVLAIQAGAYANASVGRQLRRLLSHAGLIDVHAVPQVMTIPDATTLETTLRLFSVAHAGVANGVFSPEEASAWEEDLLTKDRAGVFSCYAVMFTAHGRVSDSFGDRSALNASNSSSRVVA